MCEVAEDVEAVVVSILVFLDFNFSNELNYTLEDVHRFQSLFSWILTECL